MANKKEYLLGTRILLVDDSEVFRGFVTRLLENTGVEIISATDGLHAMSLLDQHEIDVILTDIKMPYMDGLELCREVKAMRGRQSLPVVIMSSTDSEDEVEQGFLAGASAYVPKNMLQEELIPTLQSMLEHYRFTRDKTLLVVDDSASIRTLVMQGLIHAGYEVYGAENGSEALKFLESNKWVDLVISDLQMPEIDGYQLLREIIGNSLFASMPVIMMSSVSDSATMRRLTRQGASAYLVKPFHLDELLILVDRLLSQHFTILTKENERLESERVLMLGSIMSLVSALEARDPYTRGHSDAVSLILKGMAEVHGADKKVLELVALGGRLHDIGKIGIRDQVLLKEGRLDDEEYFHIKQHPSIGEAIILPIPSLSGIVPIVRSHHERWDGRGYPHGLSGTEIPFWARAAAVADTFDALTSDRPYRTGMGLDEALHIMQSLGGSQFCPEALDLFMTWIESPGRVLPRQVS